MLRTHAAQCTTRTLRPLRPSVAHSTNVGTNVGVLPYALYIGSKYISITLSKSQEDFLKNAVGHQLLLFAMSWLGTRDIIYALILTASFTILTQYLFNETSMFYIVPKQWQKFDNHLDLDEDGLGIGLLFPQTRNFAL